MFAFLKRFKRPSAVAQESSRDPEAIAVVPRPDALLRQLEWTVIRRLDGQLQGDYRTLFRGAGLMLADLREYQAHDDVRHIDWNVTARTGRPQRGHDEARKNREGKKFGGGHKPDSVHCCAVSVIYLTRSTRNCFRLAADLRRAASQFPI